jgi:hypothetical protein
MTRPNHIIPNFLIVVCGQRLYNPYTRGPPNNYGWLFHQNLRAHMLCIFIYWLHSEMNNFVSKKNC